MAENNILLSTRDLVVKFRVRGRILTAIRGVSLDIYEDECIAIVGESGSGKSVFTKTFAGMLDENGYIDSGEIIFSDPELADTHVTVTPAIQRLQHHMQNRLNAASPLEFGAATWNKIEQLKQEQKARLSLTAEEEQAFEDEIGALVFQRTELFNLKQTFDTKKEKDRIKETASQISSLDAQIKLKQQQRQDLIAQRKQQAKGDTAVNNAEQQQLAKHLLALWETWV